MANIEVQERIQITLVLIRERKRKEGDKESNQKIGKLADLPMRSRTLELKHEKIWSRSWMPGQIRCSDLERWSLSFAQLENIALKLEPFSLSRKPVSVVDFDVIMVNRIPL